MQNHFTYFSEIEQRFQQRRGSLLLLSTLDWALIEIWREADVPLDAVLRGIDDAFDKYETRAARSNTRHRRVNGLAWCAQAVLDAADTMRTAAVGTAAGDAAGTGEGAPARSSGFEQERVAAYLATNAARLQDTAAGTSIGDAARPIVRETASRLLELATAMRGEPAEAMPLDELDRTLTVLEERLFAALLTTSAEQELTDLRTQAARELAPYRSRMQAVQIRQIEQQFLQKRLLERAGLPRLSLFYMEMA
jgi:hypothetical protein